jgi:hypothetical protein
VSSLSAEHGDIDQMRRRHILPDGIGPSEVDLLVEPAADPIVTGVGDEVRKAADILVVARFGAVTAEPRGKLGLPQVPGHCARHEYPTA